MKSDLGYLYDTSHLDAKIKSSFGKSSEVFNSPYNAYLANLPNTAKPKNSLISNDFRQPKHYLAESGTAIGASVYGPRNGRLLSSRLSATSLKPLDKRSPLSYGEANKPTDFISDRMSKLDLEMKHCQDSVTPRSGSRFSAAEEYKKQQRAVANEVFNDNYYNTKRRNVLNGEKPGSRATSLDSYRMNRYPNYSSASYRASSVPDNVDSLDGTEKSYKPQMYGGSNYRAGSAFYRKNGSYSNPLERPTTMQSSYNAQPYSYGSKLNQTYPPQQQQSEFYQSPYLQQPCIDVLHEEKSASVADSESNAGGELKNEEIEHQDVKQEIVMQEETAPDPNSYAGMAMRRNYRRNKSTYA